MSIAATSQDTQLTERQAKYLGLADEGLSYQEIGVLCGVSDRTVSSTIYHVRNRQLADRSLTARHLEILALVGAGMTDPEIGQRLYLSPKTVSIHIQSARERLDARNRVHAVMLAVALELLILDSDGALFAPHEHRVSV